MELAIDTNSLLGRVEPHSESPECGPAGTNASPNAATERNFEICDSMLDIVSALFNVSGRELRMAGRTRLPVARVRQIAMYVTHCALGLTMTDIGKGFGRDRTTVMHACHLVEDMRDEEEFDRIVNTVERIAIAAFKPRSS